MDKQEKILHVYGQGFWHNPVLIVGTLPGLEELYNTIQRAIKEQGIATSRDVFVNDGEGFVVKVSQQDEKTMERLSVPYYDDAASEKDELKSEELFKIFREKM